MADVGGRAADGGRQRAARREGRPLGHETGLRDGIDREHEDSARLRRDEIVVDGDDQDVAAVRKVRSEREPFHLFRCARPDDAVRGIEEVEEQALRHRHHARRQPLRGQGVDGADVARAAEVDQRHVLDLRAGAGVAVALIDEELVVVDREDLVDAQRRVVELVDEFARRARRRVDLEDAVVDADALVRAVERPILDEGALHDAVQLRPVRRDRQPLHAAVVLAALAVCRRQLGVFDRRMIDHELARHLQRAAAGAIGPKLVQERTVLVGDVERARRADPHALAVEAAARGRVGRVERRVEADQRLARLVAQRRAAAERGCHGPARQRQLEQVGALDVRVGARVGPAVGCRHVKIADARVRDRRTEAADLVVGDAVLEPRRRHRQAVQRRARHRRLAVDRAG